MKWGETQNILSVIIGLNVAYYAFKEMRMPHLSSLQRRIDKLYEDVSRRMDDVRIASHVIPKWTDIHRELLNIWQPVMDLRGNVNMIIELTSTRKFENLLGVPAMIVAVLATLLLIFSTVKFEDQLSLWLFYPAVLIGFAPPLAFMAMNLFIVWGAESKYGAEYTKYSGMRHDVEFKLLDYHLDIIRARYDHDHPPPAAPGS